MKKLFLLLVLSVFVIGCSEKENTADYKVNKTTTKKNVAEELSIKDIDSITARVNYSFSRNNLPIDSASFLDTVRSAISRQIKIKKDSLSKAN